MLCVRSCQQVDVGICLYLLAEQCEQASSSMMGNKGMGSEVTWKSKDGSLVEVCCMKSGIGCVSKMKG